MIKKPPISTQEIMNCLKTHYNIAAIQLTLLPLGADMHAAVYKAAAVDTAYFIKVKQGHYHDNSMAILELLHDALVPVILPIKTIDGQPTQRLAEDTLIVYPFVEGQDGFNRHLTDEQWQKLGNNLKQLHEIKVPHAIQHKIRYEDFTPKWRDLVRSYYFFNNQTESEIPHPIQISQDKIAINLGDFIKENNDAIHRLVNRAAALAEKVREQSPKFVLCHGDIHGGNVLIDKNNTIYLVDWDNPIMAPKERDLMFIGGGVANVWNKPHEERLFYAGYGKTEINKTILAYYRHERIVEDIALYVQALLLSNAGGAERAIQYQQFIDMFQPNGVVEIAFKTDAL